MEERVMSNLDFSGFDGNDDLDEVSRGPDGKFR